MNKRIYKIKFFLNFKFIVWEDFSVFNLRWKLTVCTNQIVQSRFLEPKPPVLCFWAIENRIDLKFAVMGSSTKNSQKYQNNCLTNYCTKNGFPLRDNMPETVTLSALPVARMNSEYGLKDRQLTSAVWASTVCEGLLVLLERVSQIINFWSSATEPNRDSCSKCHATSCQQHIYT